MNGISGDFTSATHALLGGLQRSSRAVNEAATEVARFGTDQQRKGLADSLVDLKTASLGYEANARALTVVDRVSRSLLAIVE